jgi:hypothetical protein
MRINWSTRSTVVKQPVHNLVPGLRTGRPPTFDTRISFAASRIGEFSSTVTKDVLITCSTWILASLSTIFWASANKILDLAPIFLKIFRFVKTNFVAI